MGGPLISVIMPVFNAGIFLRPAVESILGQTLADFEFLIVDDGSTDDSRAWLAQLNDPRIRVMLNERNLGVATARNLALDEARGEFVAFLNHDDVALPGRFARQVAFLRANPATMILGTAIETYDGEGGLLPGTVLPLDPVGIRWLGLVECPLRQSAMMIRREFIRRAQLRYNPAYQAHSDYAFVMDAVMAGPGGNLPDVLVHYRRHAGSLSRRAFARLIADGNQIACAAIARELPSQAPSLAAVAEMRSVILGYHLPGTGRTLAATKQSWKLYLDLFDAFREKHGAGANAVSARQPGLTTP